MHAVFVYVVFNARWHYPIYDLRPARTFVPFVPPEALSYPGSGAAAGKLKAEELFGPVRTVESGPPGGRTAAPGAQSAGAPEAGAAAGRGAAGAPGEGGAAKPGETTTTAPFATGFRLTYPGESKLDLTKPDRRAEATYFDPRNYAPPRTDIDFTKYGRGEGGTGGGGRFGAGLSGGPAGAGGSRGKGGSGIGISAAAARVDLSAWANEILLRVQRNWRVETGDLTPWAGDVALAVVVNKAGDLALIEIRSPSRVDLLDRSALRAVELSAPFPALPAEFPEASLELVILFHYER